MGSDIPLIPQKIQNTLQNRRGTMERSTMVLQCCFWRKLEQEKLSEFSSIMLETQGAVTDLFKEHFDKIPEEFPSQNPKSIGKISGFKPLKCLHTTIIVDEQHGGDEETDLTHYLESQEFAALWKGVKIVYDGYRIMPDGCIMLLLSAKKEGDSRFIFALRQKLYEEYFHKDYKAPKDLDLTNSLWVVLGNFKTSKLSDEQEIKLLSILKDMDEKLRQLPPFDLHELEMLIASKRTNSPKYTKIFHTVRI
jgi:hypothetical protein